MSFTQSAVLAIVIAMMNAISGCSATANQAECEVDECTPITFSDGDSGGLWGCNDSVIAPFLPYQDSQYMGVSQGPGCKGHAPGQVTSEAYDFTVNGNFETTHNMVAVAASSGIVADAMNNVTNGCDGCSGSAYNGGWGNYVLVQIDKANGNESSCFYERYAHLRFNGVFVKKGDRVCRGQALGYIGTTGNSTGDHLHFQRELSNHKSVKIDFQEAQVPSGCDSCLTATNTKGCYQSKNTEIKMCPLAQPPSGSNVSIIYTSPFGASTDSIELMGMFLPNGQWTSTFCSPIYLNSALSCSIAVPAGATGFLLNARVRSIGRVQWSCDENPCFSKAYSVVGGYSVNYAGRQLQPTQISNSQSCGCNHQFAL